MKNNTTRNKKVSFFIKVILPSILAIVLFIISIFAIIIPSFESNIMDRKREMIRELTNSAWSILTEYEKEERSGRMSRDTAQKEAMGKIRFLRYGDERKDYFWITDMKPLMVMHPYRRDLDGKDLSNFEDPHGKKLFVEFVKTIKQSKEGYVDYMWQWKDDSTRIVPKLSFVKGFEPWNWIIGTGIYTEDVKVEIGRLENRLLKISLVITLLISLLLALIMRQSLRLERNRQQAENDLKESQERYRALVEASTEGTLMLLENYIYANKAMLDLLGYEETEMNRLGIRDIISDEILQKENRSFHQLIEQFEFSQTHETKLKHKKGYLIEVVLNISKISLADKDAVIFITKNLNKNLKEKLEYEGLRYKGIAESIGVGFFKTTLARRSKFIEANSAAVKILGFSTEDELLKTNIEEFFADPGERKDFIKSLILNGHVRKKIIRIAKSNKKINYISVSITIIDEESDGKKYCEGFVEDVTEDKIAEMAKDSYIHDLQATQAFFNQPIRDIVRQATSCSYHLTIKEAVAIMEKYNCNALLVKAADDRIIGIVTGEDIRKEMASSDFNSDKAVSEIVNSPATFVSENALLYEALTIMQEHDTGNIAVQDINGKIISIISYSDLVRVQKHTLTVLIREIHDAATIDSLVQIQTKLKQIVGILVSSGINPQHITKIISSVSDAIIERVNRFAVDELGPPPAKYAFITLGSVGREEQTMATDQDNAIIFEDTSPEREVDITNYFLKFGEKVCAWLDKVGYSFCIGEVMCKNPKWCKPLSVWKEYFSHWVRTVEPQDLLEISIFFDFRFSCGDKNLAAQLQSHLYEIIENNNTFIYQLAINTLQFKPPIGFFGNIIVDDKERYPDTFNIKKAITPMIGFARVYALKNTIEETNTLNRIRKLFELNMILKPEYEKFVQMYSYLMSLRFRHQVNQLVEKTTVDNQINLTTLSEMEQMTLKKIFSHIGYLQTKINFDFKGAQS